jgi:hypothetical protein
MKVIVSIIQRLKPLFVRIEVTLDRLRSRIPGLPSNRAILAAVGLGITTLVLLGAFQVLLAPKQKFTTFTLPYEQNFDDVNLRRWFVGEGVWSIRNASLTQTVGGDAQAQAFIPYKLIEDASYHASAYITLKKDSRDAGISFNAQYPEMSIKQHRVYLSRPDKNTLELVAGYMDDAGSFVTQYQVPLSINTAEFRLDLYVYENTYLVQVNGQRMIENRPLFYKNGLIGFYTIGPVIFDTFKLTASDNPNPGNLVYSSDFDQNPGGAGWVPFSGEWKISDNQMVQTDPIVQNAGIGYETSTFQNFTLRATFSHLSRQGAGVLFNMPSPYQVNGAQIVRYSDETDSFIWGYFDDNAAFNRQGFVNVAPAGADQHIVQVFAGEQSYDIFLDDQLLARDIPLKSKHGSIGLVTSACSAAYTQIEVFPLFGISGDTSRQLTPLSQSSTPASTSLPTKFTPTTKVTQENPTQPTNKTPSKLTPTVKVQLTPVPTGKFSLTAVPTGKVNPGSVVPYHGTFTGKLADQNWVALNGNWLFQNSAFIQQRTDGYDFSAVYTKNTYSIFSYQVGFTHLQGVGAGILFNMAYIDKLTGASMVRYSDRRDNALIWGYYDDNGVYKNQGYADVNPAGSDRHILRVDSGATAYSIYLDDRLIVQNVPFGSGQNSGYIGLLTSVASASYDEVTVDSVGAAFKGSYAGLDGFSDQVMVSGKWVISNNTIVQSVPDVADYIWNTGVQASQYTMSANINLPKDSKTVGGGFLIHMNERNSKNNAYIVRLTNGGQGVWWGATDENGKFKGQGSTTFKDISSVFRFKIVVDANKLAIYVNDTQIVADVPISGTNGWVGLVAYGGPVTFTDLKLEVTQ